MKKILFFVVALVMSGLAQSQIIVSGSLDINGKTTWTNNNIYILQGFVRVTANDTLHIQPGTIIKGDFVSKGSLIVERDGFLIAQGTEMQPIVFTSQKPAGQRSYGDWGGLIICGRGAVNQPANAANGTVQGEAMVEGGVGSIYGGGANPDNNDNSGIIEYVRIEFGGIPFQPNSEINGITMCGVGAGTTINHVQVSYCGDDAFEWFGGNVNAKNLVSYKNWDDDFDTDFGYQGSVQYGLVLRDPAIADQSGSNGFESDNDATGSTNVPISQPKFSNITVVGPMAFNATYNSNYKRALHLKRNTQCSTFNSVFVGYPVGLMIEASSTQSNATNGLLKFKNNIIAQCNDSLLANTMSGLNAATNNVNGAFNITTFFNSNNNQLSAMTTDLMFNNVDLNAPNFSLSNGSPLNEGADFNDAYLSNGFFDDVNFRGGFGADNWASCWTEFDPQNQPYNSAIDNSFSAEIIADGETAFCEGNDVVLMGAASIDNVTFHWNNGAVSASQTIAENNLVEMTAMSVDGCSVIAQAVEVVVFPTPEVSIQALGNTSLCTGSSVEIISSQSEGNLWNNDEISESIIVSESGVFSTTYTDDNGCTAFSNEINVIVSDAPAPTLSASGNTEICSGESVNLTASTSETYTWYLNGAVISNEANGSLIATEAGSYAVEVTNADACNGTGISSPIFVTVTETPTADFSVIINNLGVQFLNNSTGAIGYNWNFGDGNVSSENNPSHNYGTNGSYTVTLEASNGNCTDVHTFEVLVTGTEEIMNENISLYPNPAQDQINISCPAQSTLVMTNVTGQIISTIQNTKNQEVMNVSDLANGIYFVRIVNNNVVTTMKFNKN
jgi:PKD repeat protein